MTAGPSSLFPVLYAPKPPALSLDFTNGQALDPRITFSRASDAMMYDITGKLTNAPNNLLLRSETLDNAYWSQDHSAVTANSAVAPDGSLTADTISDGTDSGVRHIFYQNGTLTLAAAPYVLSCYVKDVDRRYVVLGADTNSGATTPRVYFDLTLGTVTDTAGASGTITAVGNSWYRISCAFTAQAGTVYPQMGLSDVNNDGGTLSFSMPAYTGTSKTIYSWGWHLERVTYQAAPRDYAATIASQYFGPRFDYDPVTLNPKGLMIEGARTNLLLQSQTLDNASWTKNNATITADEAVAPDGTTTADRMTSSAHASDSQGYVQQQVTSSAGAVTHSVYVKSKNWTWFRMGIFDSAWKKTYFNVAAGTVGTVGAGVTASIQSVGNSWYRCAITFTAVGTNVFGGYLLTDADNSDAQAGSMGTDGVYLWGTQIEAGAFAASYIPTVAASVTRAAETATISGTSFSQWFNPVEGTFFAEFTTPANSFSSNLHVYEVAGAARADGIIELYEQNATTFSTNVRAAGFASQALLSLTVSMATELTTKNAMAYKENSFASAFNGALQTDNAGTVTNPPWTRMALGSVNDGTGELNGWIKSIRYFDTRLPDARLVRLTS